MDSRFSRLLAKSRQILDLSLVPSREEFKDESLTHLASLSTTFILDFAFQI